MIYPSSNKTYWQYLVCYCWAQHAKLLSSCRILPIKNRSSLHTADNSRFFAVPTFAFTRSIIQDPENRFSVKRRSRGTLSFGHKSFQSVKKIFLLFSLSIRYSLFLLNGFKNFVLLFSCFKRIFFINSFIQKALFIRIFQFTFGVQST